MKIYKAANVYEESLTRIRWLFDEFPNIVVDMSGGKDSTVVYHLARIVAEEKGRLPLKVRWLDQELEFAATVDYQREIMYSEGVAPLWYQIPFRLLNATSSTATWLNVWGEGEEWVREKDPLAIHDNPTGVDRFATLLSALSRSEADGPTAHLTGVRAEESPTRSLALTGSKTYKWATWGSKVDAGRGIYNFHPIYDWAYGDIWHAIESNDWAYNRHYDTMYQYGTPIRNMRVSNYHHETALASLWMLQEAEPETWEKAIKRIGGLRTGARFGPDDFFVQDLPPMFGSWPEYRDYLMETIVPAADAPEFIKHFTYVEKVFADNPVVLGKVYKVEVSCILVNDVGCTKLDNLRTANTTAAAYKGKSK